MSILSVRGGRTPSRRSSEDARQYTYRVIRDCILQLILPPRRKLSEVELAQSLKVSRTPVHDTFFKLSRENLVDVYPKRGAFVSSIDPTRVGQASWIHTQLGISMLHAIYVKNIDPGRLLTLRHLLRPLNQEGEWKAEGSAREAARLFAEYYHQLYVIAGDMDLVWSSIEKIDVDLRRLLCMAAASPAVTDGLHGELSNLTDALLDRDCDRACRILDEHFTHLNQMAKPLQIHYPDYFSSKEQEALS